MHKYFIAFGQNVCVRDKQALMRLFISYYQLSILFITFSFVLLFILHAIKRYAEENI